MTTILQATSPEDITAVQGLWREYIAWVDGLSGERSLAPTFSDFEQELAAMPGRYALPDGRLLLARHEGAPAGCVGFRRIDAETCELKRLYCRPSFRNLAIGWKLVLQLMEQARACGYQRVILDSHISMTRAHRIYEAVGFRPIPAPDDFPEALRGISIFLECDLTPGQGRA